MADAVTRRPLGYWSLFLALSAAWFFVRLLPLDTLPAAFPGPDLMLCLTFAWVLRRPGYMPAPLVAAVFLLEDLLLMRPPGLWALLAVLGTEFLRNRQGLLREVTFPAEWAMVAAVGFALLLAERTVLFLLIVPQPVLGQDLLQMIFTMALYPLVVLVSHFILKVRKPATGEVDALGRPL
jgi:rod shape-determining protein MreD